METAGFDCADVDGRGVFYLFFLRERKTRLELVAMLDCLFF